MLISWTGFRSKIQAQKRDKQQHRVNSLPKNPCFDKECPIEKKRVNKAKKKFLQDVNNKHGRTEYLTRKKEYRDLKANNTGPSRATPQTALGQTQQS